MDGCASPRGTPDQGPLSHDTGVGWVAPHTGQYADALSRRTKVCLILVESLLPAGRDIRYTTYTYASKLQLHKRSTIQACRWSAGGYYHPSISLASWCGNVPRLRAQAVAKNPRSPP
eukprot:scaffold13330_cov120-Isochrysis_galbana.AAC.2